MSYKVCPVCVKFSKDENSDKKFRESKLYLSISFTTHGRADEYLDISGRFHIHDGNRKSGTWSCSNGHRGKYSMIDPCPQADKNFCSWNGSFDIWEVETKPVLEEPKVENAKPGPVIGHGASIIGESSYSFPSCNVSQSHAYYIPEDSLPSGSTNFSKLTYFSDGNQMTIIVDLLNKQMEMGKLIEELSKKIEEIGKVLNSTGVLKPV